MKDKNLFTVSLVVLTTALGLLCEAGDMVFPDPTWEQATPESQSVDSAKLQAAVDYLREAAGKEGVNRMVIIRNGRMIWRGPEAAKAQGVWSVTKAFTSTAHGLLIEDGKCTLDTLAKDFDPALTKYYPTVTLRHFATMTSGLDGVGGGYDFDDQRRGDQNALVEPLPPFFPPGTKYMYWDEATQHYGYTLTQIAGESLHDYLKRRILDPIGITTLDWKWDSTGKVLNWTGGIEISAEDLARFGLLFLNRGNWNGRQLINAHWVDQATRVQVPPSIPNALPNSSRKGSGVYGYHWWPNGITPEGQRRWPYAPLSTYSRSGYNNNDLFVVPAWNMVTVRLGLDENEDQITSAEYNTFLRMVGEAILEPVVDGELRVWHPVTVRFRGPAATETDDEPNPFLDYRLQVVFVGPSGQRYDVPGFFDGDGCGGGSGNVWCARFAPDEAGRWSFLVSLRTGQAIAVSLDPAAGRPAGCDGVRGGFDVAASDPAAPGFLKWGRLKYVGGHYLKFVSGPYWIRGGTDSPENFLAYSGFDRTTPSHHYADHVADWQPGDPDWGEARGRGIIGAINYLAAHGVNSIYFLTHNIGGDGKDVWPWIGRPNPNGSPKNDNLHYDIGKLRQWETVFTHAQRQGVFLHFVFNEAEAPNKRELDDGELGTERKLYYRELIARFGHHLALEWNLCEEYNLGFDFGPDRVRSFAEYVKAIDPYDHPITVHSASDPLKALQFTFGDPLFGLTSIQLGQNKIDVLTEQFREATARAGRPLPVSMDEFTLDKGQEQGWLPVDDAERWRTEKLWPTYLSGGNIEFILGDLLETDSFKTPEREKLWAYVLYARRFLEALPFWEMEPADQLVAGASTISVTQNRGRKTYAMGAQVLTKPGEVYAVYLPKAEGGAVLDLSGAKGRFHQRWYNPRTGEFEGPTVNVSGGARTALGKPPREAGEDWAVLVERAFLSQDHIRKPEEMP
jgi:CubicO group peptidase (beta-lactamase class C family)